MTSFFIEWTAPEFSYRHKGVSWYWISITLAVLIVGFSIWEKNFFFGVFVVIAEILVLTWANQEPREVSFDLNERGLEIDKLKFYAIADFQNFSIEDAFDPDWPDIYFEFKSKIKPVLKIKVPGDKLVEIQKNLKTMLPQIPHERTLMEAIEQIIGF